MKSQDWTVSIALCVFLFAFNGVLGDVLELGLYAIVGWVVFSVLFGTSKKKRTDTIKEVEPLERRKSGSAKEVQTTNIGS